MPGVKLSGGGLTVDLHSWRNRSDSGMEALAGITGTGFPNIETQWFDGAGDGSTWQGSRVKRRDLSLPVYIYGDNRADLNAKLSKLATIMNPTLGESVLSISDENDDDWTINVVRSGLADWARRVDTDNETYVKLKLNLEAGFPYFTRSRVEEFSVKRGRLNRSLLPRLAALRISGSSTYGPVSVENAGDAPAYPYWVVQGPLNGFTLVSSTFETIQWTGRLYSGEALYIDTRHGTVKDNSGANRYSELAPAPKFWAVPPGSSTIYVAADVTDAESYLSASWSPARWTVI